jgi:hypothetical protein
MYGHDIRKMTYLGLRPHPHPISVISCHSRIALLSYLRNASRGKLALFYHDERESHLRPF